MNLGGRRSNSAERIRLEEARSGRVDWKHWGPYLSERQWGTVREDYSAAGTAWDYLSHDHARSNAYRWGEDGIFGLSDSHQDLCFSIALWNGNDPILKERLFGLTGSEGNHGEDVKECYYYLDNTPTHSYMKGLYKYPQAAFPYDDLVRENRRRGREMPEYELIDSGIFAEDRYFDVFVHYAKASPEDILIEIEIVNRSSDSARLVVLPTILFRNTWSWNPGSHRPMLVNRSNSENVRIEADHSTLGRRMLYAAPTGVPMFTENETNYERLYGTPNASRYAKDGINDAIVSGDMSKVNPNGIGSKASVVHDLAFAPGERKTIRLLLSDSADLSDPLGKVFSDIFARRITEAAGFYAKLNSHETSDDVRAVQRQAFAGMLWSKQFYSFSVHEWIAGDSLQPPPPTQRKGGRNSDWQHLESAEILSMPDTWEYPWFAAWDLAFHTLPLALVDSEFAKQQLMLLTREWYMHPSGQLPAYEWAFGDVNPPVHAWAALRIFRIEKKERGEGDYLFLERVFQKLLINFTWWVNRKDAEGNNVFQGGFLGLDNIGVFDRSAPLPTGGFIDQSDGTSWMGVYSLNMLAIAIELAQQNPAYQDVASKFFEHFLYIADAMNTSGGRMAGLWDREESFYVDVLLLPDGSRIPLKIRSLVGLIPLLAVESVDPAMLARLPEFAERMQWFIDNRPKLRANVACMETPGAGSRRLLAIVGADRLREILRAMLDEAEFLSPYGIRALSKRHDRDPYVCDVMGSEYVVRYEPAESTTGLFGGNSNWRGPVWFPLNYLLIEALQKFHHYLGDDFRVEFPTGSGKELSLWDVSAALSERLINIFRRGDDGRRPVFGGNELLQHDAQWRDYLLFNEYFHGDNGAGIGASHQTGWTGLVAKLIQQRAEYGGAEK